MFLLILPDVWVLVVQIVFAKQLDDRHAHEVALALADGRALQGAVQHAEKVVPVGLASDLGVTHERVRRTLRRITTRRNAKGVGELTIEFVLFGYFSKAVNNSCDEE